MIISKNSIKIQIQNQVPWFYNQDYPLFVKFLEYYYEWVETFSKENEFGYQAILDNLLKLQDIDNTLDEIIPFFKQVYFRLLPEETFVPTRLFAKQIVELYKSKGTLKSIELLIFIILGKPVDLFLPKITLARSSNNLNGKEYFIDCFEELSSPISLYEINKNFIKIDDNEYFVNEVFKVNESFKLFLDLENVKNFTSNKVYFNDILIARCFSLLSKIKIKESNPGNKLGEIITISTDLNNLQSAKIVVSEISKGVIDNYIIHNNGYGYKKGEKFINLDINFEAEIFSVSDEGEVYEIVFVKRCDLLETIPKINIISENGKGLEIFWLSSELGKIQNVEILNSGMNMSSGNLYFSKPGNIFDTEISYIGIHSRNISSINNLGNYNILPDNYLNQNFSYVLEMEMYEKNIDKKIILDLVHPAGFLDFYNNTIIDYIEILETSQLISFESEPYYIKQILENFILFNNNFYELLKFSNEDIFLNFQEISVSKLNHLYYLSSESNVSIENILSLDDFANIDEQNTKINNILNLLISE